MEIQERHKVVKWVRYVIDLVLSMMFSACAAIYLCLAMRSSDNTKPAFLSCNYLHRITSGRPGHALVLLSHHLIKVSEHVSLGASFLKVDLILFFRLQKPYSKGEKHLTSIRAPVLHLDIIVRLAVRLESDPNNRCLPRPQINKLVLVLSG